MTPASIDFHHIVAHLGSQDEAFEEFCCQNAHHVASPTKDSEFVRYRGAGGDGGVECVWRLPNGKEWGWQVKYVFDFPTALIKLSESLATAIQIHPQLERYTVCLPFNLTGPTGRKTRKGGLALSQQERFDQWRLDKVREAREAGVDLSIHLETPSTLLDSLHGYDPDGGRLRFWFNAVEFGEQWFVRHIEDIQEQAGPRYTPELSIEVPAAQALEGLGLTERWFDEVSQYRKNLTKLAKDWSRGVGNTKSGGWDSPFPGDLRAEGEMLVALLSTLLAHLASVVVTRCVPIPAELPTRLVDEALPGFREIRVKLARLIDEEHGEGSSESASFKQFQAEYQVSFPTANLDRAKDVVKGLEDLSTLLGSAATCVAGKDEALLIGEAGSGKTHVICDAAVLRQARNLRTVVLFGERFSGMAEPWTQIGQHLGVSGNISRDALLSALDAAGEATGYPLLLCIDGLNETVPRRYWQSNLPSMVAQVRRYPFVKLCVSCRSTYLSQVLPDSGQDWFVLRHEGFKGMEFDACQAFFAFYGLEAPMTPIMQTEFANPLFLKLICSAAKERGYARLPTGWQGIFTAVSALLEAKNRRFASQHEISALYRIPEKGLQLFIAAARAGTRGAVPFDEAARIVQAAVPPGVACGPLLDWLLGESMLIADAEADASSGAVMDYVRISFDRLGDHLLASKFLEELTLVTIQQSFSNGGPLAFCVQDRDAFQNNKGLLEALSVQIPERFGRELPNCVSADELEAGIVAGLVGTTVRSLLWRDPKHLTYDTAEIVWQALMKPGMANMAFDSLVEVSVQPSPVDALYLDTLLKSKEMAERDAFWCPHLFRSFEEKGPVHQLIRAGLEMDLAFLNEKSAVRWATTLLWFCAAADRRVRDHATKALVRVTEKWPALWAELLYKFADCDDEYVVERCLLCAYGALLRCRDTAAEQVVAQAAHDTVFRDVGRFQNAAIRDHARSILELAASDGLLPEGIKEEDYLPPYKSEWPLVIPTEQDLKPFIDDRQSYPKLYSSCTFDDFFTYGLYRVGAYDHVVTKPEMGRWIFRHVLDLGYGLPSHANYDGFMLGKFGGGRGRPMWAERIGKKYQWIALSRLAARLSDNNAPKEDTWEPVPAMPPLTYLRGRDIDPSLLKDDSDDAGVWWQPVSYDFSQITQEVTEWLNDPSDMPDSLALISLADSDGHKWLALENHPHWTEEKGDADREEEAKGDRHDLWMQIRSYLVSEDEFDECWQWLERQHFMGRWMPEGSEFHEGFVGEYPWATTFNTHPDSWSATGGFSGDKDVLGILIPTCNSLNSHDEYDAFQTTARTIHLPSRRFFDGYGLRWDCGDGFNGKTGNCCFRDPSFLASGPSCLLVNPEFLTKFLRAQGLRIIWTVLAEKLVLTDRALPRLKFSSVHTLSGEGWVSSRPNIKMD